MQIKWKLFSRLILYKTEKQGRRLLIYLSCLHSGLSGISWAKKRLSLTIEQPNTAQAEKFWNTMRDRQIDFRPGSKTQTVLKVMERKRFLQRTQNIFQNLLWHGNSHKIAGLRETLKETNWHARSKGQGRDSWFQTHLLQCSFTQHTWIFYYLKNVYSWEIFTFQIQIPFGPSVEFLKGKYISR